MLKLIIRTIITYVFVTLSIRLMGKRQIGDMQPNELVITLLISEIAAIPLQDVAQPLSIGLVSIFMLVVLEIVMSVIAMKSNKLSQLLNGKAVVVMKNGTIDQKALKSVRMTVSDLIELLRIQGVFELEDVHSAILEVNGSLSVKLKGEREPATVSDVGGKPKTSGIPMLVVSDGKIIEHSLEFLNLTKERLYHLINENRKHLSDIYVMTLNDIGESIIIEKEKS